MKVLTATFAHQYSGIIDLHLTAYMRHVLILVQAILFFCYGAIVHAAGGGTTGDPDSVCNDQNSFLGVGNVDCIGENLATATFLLAVIVFLSIVLEWAVMKIRSLVSCPQMRKIVNRLFEEIMILGFISALIFAMDSKGALSRVGDFQNNFDATEERHFKEFFHYIVFLSMIYYIFIVMGT